MIRNFRADDPTGPTAPFHLIAAERLAEAHQEGRGAQGEKPPY